MSDVTSPVRVALLPTAIFRITNQREREMPLFGAGAPTLDSFEAFAALGYTSCPDRHQLMFDIT